MRAALSTCTAAARQCCHLVRPSRLARRAATDSSPRAARAAAAAESGDGSGAQPNIASRTSRRRMAHVPDFHTFLSSEREQRTTDLIAMARARRAEQGPASSFGTEACTDKFGRRHSYLRLSLTERCNLRCRYCMPAEGVSLQDKEHMLRGDEVVAIAEHFHKLGVNKIRLTGGEPLISKDLNSICSKIGALPGLESLAITTNGIALSRKLPTLVSQGKFTSSCLQTLQTFVNLANIDESQSHLLVQNGGEVVPRMDTACQMMLHATSPRPLEKCAMS